MITMMKSFFEIKVLYLKLSFPYCILIHRSRVVILRSRVVVILFIILIKLIKFMYKKMKELIINNNLEVKALQMLHHLTLRQW